ncbi:hypothetical protein AAMO2058_000458400 [Amorphochlora amoebiformis]
MTGEEATARPRVVLVRLPFARPKSVPRAKWSEDLDKRLMNIVRKSSDRRNGFINWREVALEMDTPLEECINRLTYLRLAESHSSSSEAVAKRVQEPTRLKKKENGLQEERKIDRTDSPDSPCKKFEQKGPLPFRGPQSVDQSATVSRSALEEAILALKDTEIESIVNPMMETIKTNLEDSQHPSHPRDCREGAAAAAQ